MSSEKRTTYTPSEVAARLGVGRTKVMSWITSKQLRALNVATSPGGKLARWRIDEADLLAFEAARASCSGTATPPASITAAAPTGAKASRLRRQVTDFIE